MFPPLVSSTPGYSASGTSRASVAMNAEARPMHASPARGKRRRVRASGDVGRRRERLCWQTTIDHSRNASRRERDEEECGCGGTRRVARAFAGRGTLHRRSGRRDHHASCSRETRHRYSTSNIEFGGTFPQDWRLGLTTFARFFPKRPRLACIFRRASGSLARQLFQPSSLSLV
jgi:hypothetical protein